MNYFPLLKLGIPIAITASASTAMDQVNTYFTAPLGSAPLSAVSVISSLLMIFYVSGKGLGIAQTNLIANYRGQNAIDLAQKVFTSSLIIRLVYSLLSSLIIYQVASHIEFFGLSTDVGNETRKIIDYFALGCFFSIFGNVFSDLLESYEEAKSPMYISFLGIFIHALTTYFLLGGSIPEISGAKASGFGFALGQGISVCLLFFRARHLFGHEGLPPHPSIQLVKQITRNGTPLCLQFFCECTSFALTAILIGNIGTDDLAARQVANSVTQVTFLLPLGLSRASLILVSKEIGQNGKRAALSLVKTTLILTICIMFIQSCLVYGLRNSISDFYGLTAQAAVIALPMLVIAAVFQIADGTQVVTSALLRAYQDYKIPAFLIIFAWWGVAIPLEWLLGFYFKGGSLGVWTGLAIGVFTSGLLLSARLWFIVQKIPSA